MKKKWIVTAVVLAVFVGAAILYNVLGRKKTAGGDAPAVENVRGRSVLRVNGEVVAESSISDGIKTMANLLPDEEVSLSFEMSGKVVAIHFQEGTMVRKGQLLAKINDAPLQAQLKRYEAQLKLAEARVYRQSTLLEKDAVSQEAFEQASTELATLNADIDLVKANIAQTELRAPFDGFIGLRYVSEGAYATPSTVVSVLTKMSPLKLELAVSEKDAQQIRSGAELPFTVEGDLNRYTATVYATESRVDTETKTFLIRARYPNSRFELMPGRYADVSLQTTAIDDAITIPSEALIKEMGVDKVYLYKSGRAEPREVEIGIRNADRVQTVHGLQPGDTLITTGTLQLRTGLNVELDRIATP